ncbi:hypothetical protein SD457_16010 [Coprobacillaceae bacterium CR2/5/TPMF4]|nr:hypothetical protein SD457_16010 [Coprobacillaceae bacterium CR2/5/TPMF4]
MLNSAEEIIKYIGDAKKQTPVKVYLNGKDLPATTEFKILEHQKAEFVLVI